MKEFFKDFIKVKIIVPAWEYLTMCIMPPVLLLIFRLLEASK